MPRFLRLIVDCCVDFTAMHGNLFGRLDSQADLIPANFHHCDDDVIVNDNAFVLFTRKNQHQTLLSKYLTPVPFHWNTGRENDLQTVYDGVNV